MHRPLDIQASDNLITLTFAGDLLQKDESAFLSALAYGTKLIFETYQKNHNKKVKVLLDMREFSGEYCAQTMQMLVDFAKDNKPFVEKTASFGGSEKIKMTGEIVTALAHRDNIRVCDTQDEALTFLTM